MRLLSSRRDMVVLKFLLVLVLGAAGGDQTQLSHRTAMGVASAASKLLRDPKSSAATKSVAASALTQKATGSKSKGK